MGIIKKNWGTSFLNSCFHGLQKLNYYNHVFFKLFANTWIGPKIYGSLKNKIQVLESEWNVFASIWFFFQTPQYWCGDHSNIIFWVIEFVSITKIIPNP